MIKNILGADFKYEENKMYRFNKKYKKWTCCNDNKPNPLYIQIEINNKFYQLHRLIYKYHNEDWDITDNSKDNHIDHININSLDNRIENLRILTNSQNQRNRKKKPNCSSKYIGVTKNGKKWKVVIRIGSKNKYLGLFKTEEEAAEAYIKKKEELMKL